MELNSYCPNPWSYLQDMAGDFQENIGIEKENREDFPYRVDNTPGKATYWEDEDYMPNPIVTAKDYVNPYKV